VPGRRKSNIWIFLCRQPHFDHVIKMSGIAGAPLPPADDPQLDTRCREPEKSGKELLRPS
jgi:hypothetical protein